MIKKELGKFSIKDNTKNNALLSIFIYLFIF